MWCLSLNFNNSFQSSISIHWREVRKFLDVTNWFFVSVNTFVRLDIRLNFSQLCWSCPKLVASSFCDLYSTRLYRFMELLWNNLARFKDLRGFHWCGALLSLRCFILTLWFDWSKGLMRALSLLWRREQVEAGYFALSRLTQLLNKTGRCCLLAWLRWNFLIGRVHSWVMIVVARAVLEEDFTDTDRTGIDCLFRLF